MTPKSKNSVSCQDLNLDRHQEQHSEITSQRIKSEEDMNGTVRCKRPVLLEYMMTRSKSDVRGTGILTPIRLRGVSLFLKQTITDERYRR